MMYVMGWIRNGMILVNQMSIVKIRPKRCSIMVNHGFGLMATYVTSSCRQYL